MAHSLRIRCLSALGCLAALSAPIAACGDSSNDVPPNSGVDGGGSSNDPVVTGPGPSEETDAGSLPSDAGRRPPTTTPLDLTTVEPGKWAWFEFPETVCRDGSKAGIGVNVSPTGSKKVMFELEGGGACFNFLTCLANFGNVQHKSAGGGMFDRTKPENPFAEYTHVHVPYCTGDVHAGNRRDVTVGGVGGKQQFVGYANAAFFLEKVYATFPEIERLVVMGPSAGGFGAAANFGQALRIFPGTPVNLIDDSGPLMADPPSDCLQDQWKKLFGFDETIIAECGADCAGQPDYLRAAAKHWAATAKNAMGLISATGDGTIRFMFGFGANNCGIPSTPSEAKYAEGLQALKTFLAPHPNFGMFLYGGTNHTVLTDERFYTTTVGDKTTAQWARDIVERDTVSNVGP